MSAVAHPRVKRAPPVDTKEPKPPSHSNSRDATEHHHHSQNSFEATGVPADDAPSSAHASSGTSPKTTTGRRKVTVSATTKQGIDASISKFDSFLQQLRERDSGKLSLAASVRPIRPGEARGELKYVTHPLVLNARAALMSPEGRQKKPEVANEDERRGTKLEEILFRRRPCLKNPAASPAGNAMGNERQRAPQSTELVTGKNSSSPTSNQLGPSTGATSPGATRRPTESKSSHSDRSSVTFKDTTTIIEPRPSETGKIGHSLGNVTQIPPFRSKNSNDGDDRSRSSDSVGSSSNRMVIPLYKPKTDDGIRPNSSNDRSSPKSLAAHVDGTSTVNKTRSNSPRSTGAARRFVLQPIPPYRPRRENDAPLTSTCPIRNADQRNETSKDRNGSRPEEIPPFQGPANSEPQRPIANSVHRDVTTVRGSGPSEKNGSQETSNSKAKPAIFQKNSWTEKTAVRQPPIPAATTPAGSVRGQQSSSEKTASFESGRSSPKGNKFDRDGPAATQRDAASEPRSPSPGVGKSQNRKQQSTASKPPPLPTASISSAKPPSLPTNSTSSTKSPNSTSSAKPPSLPNSTSASSAKPPSLPNSTSSSKPPSLPTSSTSSSKPKRDLDLPPKPNDKKPDPRKLRLQNSWTLYYDSRSGSKAVYGNKDKYESNLQTICTVDNVADFCGVCNNVPKPSEMEVNSNFHMFKNGIKPMWEDPANEQGGACTVSFGRQMSPEVVNRCWTALLCATVGETMDPNDEVCGVVLSRRARGDRLSVWVRDGRDERTNVEIRRRLDDLLDLRNERVTIEFTRHENYMGSGTLYGK